MTVPGLSYASGTSEIPLIGRTIGDDLVRTAGRVGEREALVDIPSGRRWSYRELNGAVDRVASGLLRLGIVKGDRVGIWAPNCAEWVLVQYAAARIGAILVNINPAYRSHELAHVLNQSTTRMLIAARSFKSSDYAAMIDEVRGDCPALADVVLLDSDAWRAIAESDIDGEALASARRRSALMTRSTSSTRPERQASRRARPFRTTTS